MIFGQGCFFDFWFLFISGTKSQKWSIFWDCAVTAQEFVIIIKCPSFGQMSIFWGLVFCKLHYFDVSNNFCKKNWGHRQSWGSHFWGVPSSSGIEGGSHIFFKKMSPKVSKLAIPKSQKSFRAIWTPEPGAISDFWTMFTACSLGGQKCTPILLLFLKEPKDPITNKIHTHFYCF